MTVLEALVAVFVASMSSVGLWAFISKKLDAKSAQTLLLRGLARNDIIALGMKYTKQGWITVDEYDDFMHYLYEPYTKFGGNGLAERIVNEVKNLPILKESPETGEIKTISKESL